MGADPFIAFTVGMFAVSAEQAQREHGIVEERHAHFYQHPRAADMLGDRHLRIVPDCRS